MRRVASLHAAPDLNVITNDLGEFIFADHALRALLEQNALQPTHPRHADLEGRGMLDAQGPTDGLAAVVKRTRKAFMLEGPALHIFVVTLRCDHACQYCQVSRASIDASGFDMSETTALLALDRVFESDAQALTLEFQGGEPSLRMDLIRTIVATAVKHPARADRVLRFTMATTLHRLTDDDLAVCRDHAIHLSTSLDGPEPIHAAQRSLPGQNSWSRTIEALKRARSFVGQDGVVALPTITRAAIAAPEAIVDAYVEQGFRSIFLRPLAPYGFARKTQKQLGYSTQEFLAFYDAALRHILDLNLRGIEIEETTAAIALRHIFTPFHSGYVDLRSPSGAGLGVLVYNYDGHVYPSDEARMAAETGDRRFVLGAVALPLDDLLNSEAMHWLVRGAIAEQHPDCASCAFVPYCGADPVYHAIAQGEPDAPRHGTSFCDRNMALFQWLFAEIAKRDTETMRTFLAWALAKPRNEVIPGWIEQ